MGAKWNFDRKTITKITAWLGKHVDRWKTSHETIGCVLHWPELASMMREEIGIDPPFGFAKTVRRILESLDLPPKAMVFKAPIVVGIKPARLPTVEINNRLKELTARIEAIEKFIRE